MAKAPELTIRDILTACAAGKFVPLEKPLAYAFCGAPEGTIVCQDLDGWLVLLSWDDDNVHKMRIEAHNEDDEDGLSGGYYNVGVGWEHY